MLVEKTIYILSNVTNYPSVLARKLHRFKNRKKRIAGFYFVRLKKVNIQFRLSLKKK